jgi:hypothetical protein
MQHCVCSPKVLGPCANSCSLDEVVQHEKVHSIHWLAPARFLQLQGFIDALVRLPPIKAKESVKDGHS